MAEEEKEERNIKLLITIILYLLLAIAFMTPYEIAKYELSKVGSEMLISALMIELFIFGGLAILFLSFAYIIKNKWLLLVGYISTIPFILKFFYWFTKVLFHSVSGGDNMRSGWDFFLDLIDLIYRLLISPSILIIMGFMVLFILLIILRLRKSD